MVISPSQFGFILRFNYVRFSNPCILRLGIPENVKLEIPFGLSLTMFCFFYNQVDVTEHIDP